jgi:light-regulated signal transduction histidine kinase (bacteriophytochrome)
LKSRWVLNEYAIWFNERKKVFLKIKRCSENENEFCFYIKDNGTGIPKYKLKFFIFSKLESNNASSGIETLIVKKKL